MRALVLLLVACAPLAACGLMAESLVRGQVQRGGGPCRGEMSRIREQTAHPTTRGCVRGNVHTVAWDYERPQDLVVHFTWTEQSGGCSVFVESA